MNTKAMYKLTYGLYLATVKVGEKANGCIINTVVQVANSPTRVSVSINNANYTCDMLKQSGKLVVSALSTQATMQTFTHFGFQSGRNVDKFAGLTFPEVDGIPYLPYACCGYLVCKVLNSTDLGSHTLFICEVVEGDVISDETPLSYAYYQEHIKPQPAPRPEKTGYRCTICNYVHEGDTLPADFICPICKHGAEDFVKI